MRTLACRSALPVAYAFTRAAAEAAAAAAYLDRTLLLIYVRHGNADPSGGRSGGVDVDGPVDSL